MALHEYVVVWRVLCDIVIGQTNISAIPIFMLLLVCSV